LFHDNASRSWITSIRLGAQPIASLGIRGVELSDSVLQGLANLVAIGLERARVQDATSRAEAARQSDELKSTLLDALAHEFKTPLTSIRVASSSLLSIHNLQPSQQHELISVIDEEADRLSQLVTEAIQMARIESGRIHLNRESHDVKRVLESVVEKIKSFNAERTIEMRVAEGLPPVWADRELIEIALRQLIDNALKYSPAASSVEVAAELAVEQVVISVTDHGSGIPEDEQDRIFEKFYRVEASRHRIPGAGLGLVIAREIIRTNGGDIWVESKLGAGSIFRFSLPVT
jgi:two-component system, OmpR family, sensor histidine kinase KdpD